MDDMNVEREMRDPRAERRAGGPVERSEVTAKQMILAGMGAVALAFDRAQDRFDRFVERGEQVQRDFEERTGDMRRDYRTAPRRSGDYFRSAMTMFLDGLNVPSKADVDVINAKLNILTRKLDNIQVERAGSGTEGASATGTDSPSGQPEIPPAPQAQTEDEDLAT